jgi:undecaprenyl-diphosphatase
VAEKLNRRETHLLRDSWWLPARAPNRLVVVTTTAARGGGLWLAVAALLGRRPGPGRRAARHGVRAMLVGMAVNFLVGKAVVRRPRPRAGNVPARRALVERLRSSSFPSSHATSAAAFVTAVALESPAWAAAIAPLAAVVAYSRLRTRAHWPSDVLAGAALGVAAAVALRRPAPRGTAARGRKRHR